MQTLRKIYHKVHKSIMRNEWLTPLHRWRLEWYTDIVYIPHIDSRSCIKFVKHVAYSVWQRTRTGNFQWQTKSNIQPQSVKKAYIYQMLFIHSNAHFSCFHTKLVYQWHKSPKDLTVLIILINMVNVRRQMKRIFKKCILLCYHCLYIYKYILYIYIGFHTANTTNLPNNSLTLSLC
jgi:hypothetical protein